MESVLQGGAGVGEGQRASGVQVGKPLPKPGEGVVVQRVGTLRAACKQCGEGIGGEFFGGPALCLGLRDEGGEGFIRQVDLDGHACHYTLLAALRQNARLATMECGRQAVRA